MSGKPLHYWDTSIWLAWIKDEVREPGEMEGVTEIVQNLKNGEADILTSAVTRIEILATKLIDNQRDRFIEMIEGPGVTEVALDPFVAEIASEIRGYYAEKRPEGTKMKVPDAIHLATAIHCEATEFNHFESGRNSMSYSKLGSPIAGKYTLTIKRPMKEQTELRLDASGATKEE